MKFYVYILFSFSKDAYYIGHTGDDLQEMIDKHNTDNKNLKGHAGGWLLMHHEAFTSKADAIYRENQIKKWKGREQIEKLIGFVLPDL